MVGAQAGLVDGQGALVQGAGALEVALGAQDVGEVGEPGSRRQVFGSMDRLGKRKCLLGKLSRLLVASTPV